MAWLRNGQTGWAWLELYNDGVGPRWMFPVPAGHQMFSNVFYDAPNNGWVLSISDQTNGNWASGEWVFPTGQGSAEWIVEVQTNEAVPAFSPVTFTTAMWFSPQGAQPIDSPYAVTTWNVQLRSPVSGCVTPFNLRPDGPSGSAFDDYSATSC
jgi:hypothetical protein